MRLRGQRWSNEEGREASSRNWGRLGLGLIPLALGLGAAVWLGTYIEAHRFGRALSQEDRAATAVGAGRRPAAKLVIDITSAQTYCAGATRADADGEMLRVYATNDCLKPLTGMSWHYDELSPDGTTLHSRHLTDACPFPRFIGDKAECVFGDKYTGLSQDARVATVRVWTVPYSK